MSVGRHSYVPFYASDWLAGTARMTRLHKSVYFDICCYIWDKAEACPEAELPLMLGDLPNWRELVEDLVRSRKLTRTADSTLTNDRALSEARQAFDLWQRKSAGGKKRQSSRSDESTHPKTAGSSADSYTGGELPENQNQNQNQQEESPQPPFDPADPDGEEEGGGEELPPATPREDDAVDEAFRLYNATADRAGLPLAQVMTERRGKQLRRRLAECGGIEGWRVAMAKLAASPLCTGDNERGWRADLDFVLQPRSFTRLMEGFYDARAPVGRAAGGGGIMAGYADLIERARKADQRNSTAEELADPPETPW